MNENAEMPVAHAPLSDDALAYVGPLLERAFLPPKDASFDTLLAQLDQVARFDDRNNGSNHQHSGEPIARMGH